MRLIPLCFIGLTVMAIGCAKSKPVTVHGKPVEHWVQALHDPNVRVRQQAAQVLGNVGSSDPAVVPALAGAVKDPEPSVRSAAVLSLLRIGPDARGALPTLREAQNDKDPKVRSQAAKALARIQGG
jgi:HEAT repeat protein